MKNVLCSRLFAVILFAVIVLGRDYVHNGAPRISPDTVTYEHTSRHLDEVFCGNVDITRTPVYPVFLALCRFLAGESYCRQFAVNLQYFIALIAVYYFYRICLAVFRSAWCVVHCSILFVLVNTFMRHGFNNDAILTESLSGSAMIFFFYTLTSYTIKPEHGNALLLGIWLILMIMLRPAFSVFVPVMFLFWGAATLCLHSSWKKHLTGFAATVVVLLSVWGYSSLVFQKCGVFSPTWVSSYNQFHCIVQAGLYETGSDPVMNEKIRKILDEWKEQHPDKLVNPNWLLTAVYWEKDSPLYGIYWMLLAMQGKTTAGEYSDDSIHLNPVFKDGVKKISSYSRQTISKHKLAYLFYVIRKIFVYAHQKEWLVIFGSLVLSGFTLLICLRKNTAEDNLLHVCCLLLTAGMIFTAFALAQAEYLRLIAPVLPLIILQAFLIFDRLLLLLRRQKTVSDHT